MADRNLTIRQGYHVEAPVETVFRALTEPEELTRWFLTDAVLPPERGATYVFTWTRNRRHSGKVMDFVRNQRLTLSWPAHGLGDTRVTLSVRPDAQGTRLEVRHTGYRKTDAWLKIYGGTQSGWAYYLTNLKSVLEHGHDLRAPGDSE
ncbi:MAG: SRPBCC domain-containing protein [Thermoplasmata archaeon]